MWTYTEWGLGLRMKDGERGRTCHVQPRNFLSPTPAQASYPCARPLAWAGVGDLSGQRWEVAVVSDRRTQALRLLPVSLVSQEGRDPPIPPLRAQASPRNWLQNVTKPRVTLSEKEHSLHLGFSPSLLHRNTMNLLRETLFKQ